MASLAYYLVLFLYLHACTARLLLESDHDLPSKDVESSLGGISIVDNHKIPSLEERQNIGGKKIRASYPWKMLSHATGSLERADRWMSESWASNVSSKNEEKTTEKIDVMDYAQPHRKPPIHNKGT